MTINEVEFTYPIILRDSNIKPNGKLERVHFIGDSLKYYIDSINNIFMYKFGMKKFVCIIEKDRLSRESINERIEKFGI